MEIPEVTLLHYIPSLNARDIKIKHQRGNLKMRGFEILREERPRDTTAIS